MIKKKFLSGYGEITFELFKQIAKQAFNYANDLGLEGQMVKNFEVHYIHVANPTDPLDNSIWIATYEELDETS